jgi:hypothetical protein
MSSASVVRTIEVGEKLDANEGKMFSDFIFSISEF